MPVLADALPTMDASARPMVRERLCGGSSFSPPDWTALNWSGHVADEARRRACSADG